MHEYGGGGWKAKREAKKDSEVVKDDMKVLGLLTSVDVLDCHA